jgi:hypothetical protein
MIPVPQSCAMMTKNDADRLLEMQDSIGCMMKQECSLHYNCSAVPRIGSSRLKIVQWFYNVAAAIHADGEIVHIAISFFDRFAATTISCDDRQVDGKMQVVAFGAFSLALKVHDPATLPYFSEQISTLSGDKFGVQHMEQVEILLLRVLEWALHPPTAYSMVRYLLRASYCSMKACHNSFRSIANEDEMDMLTKTASLACDLSLKDFTLIGAFPSTVALAAIYNAVEKCVREGSLIPSVGETICQSTAHCCSQESLVSLETTRHCLKNLCCENAEAEHENGLREIYQRAERRRDISLPQRNNDRDQGSASPVCVSGLNE